jgi:hypothetical protein
MDEIDAMKVGELRKLAEELGIDPKTPAAELRGLVRESLKPAQNQATSEEKPPADPQQPPEPAPTATSEPPPVAAPTRQQAVTMPQHIRVCGRLIQRR